MSGANQKENRMSYVRTPTVKKLLSTTLLSHLPRAEKFAAGHHSSSLPLQCPHRVIQEGVFSFLCKMIISAMVYWETSSYETKQNKTRLFPFNPQRVVVVVGDDSEVVRT